MDTDTELRQEKLKRLNTALQKLKEIQAAEPAGDAGAQQRSTANYLTVTYGISRPLSDRYVAQVVELQKAGLNEFTDAHIQKVSDLDDKFGAAFMVLPDNVDRILKGGKQMSRRFRRWGDPGDVFRVKGKQFRLFKVVQMQVGDITDDDIRKEGFASRDEFEEMWVRSHPKAVAAGKKLDPEGWCWSHEYEAL